MMDMMELENIQRRRDGMLLDTIWSFCLEQVENENRWGTWITKFRLENGHLC